MGRPYSKIEEKEVIISQNTGAGNNNASENETESHMRTNNILLTTLITLVGVIALYLLYKKYKECHRNWTQREMRAEFVRRIQSRLSGRRNPNATTEEAENAV